MRFLLIKSRLATSHPQTILDFFFDPTMERNLLPLPSTTVSHTYPTAKLKVAIIGGGPAGLSSAICLAEKAGEQVEIHVYERRWIVNSNAVSYFSSVRRDQVVTLQDSVTNLMSKETRQALFADRLEHVWPSSANIKIRQVEDRLLERSQARAFRSLIHLHPEAIDKETLLNFCNFHVLIGADGASSW